MKFLFKLILLIIPFSLTISCGSDLKESEDPRPLDSFRKKAVSFSYLPETSKLIIKDASKSNAEKIKAADRLSDSGNKRGAERIYRFIMNDPKADFLDRFTAMNKLRRLGVIV